MKPFPLYLVTLTAAFVALDVAGKIDWSWWLVTLPLLFALAMMLLSAIAVAIGNAGKDK